MSAAKLAPVRLIPLQCSECHAPLPAQPNEVAWVCEQCGRGLMLDSQNGTIPLSVFFSSAIEPGKTGRPFWVVRGQVNLRSRQTYKGDEGRAAQAFWGEARLFYVPAWDCPLNELISQGKSLLQKPVSMQPGSRTAFLPVVTLPTDLRSLGEFLVLSIEAERRDMLKTIDFDLSLDPPQLWILP